MDNFDKIIKESLEKFEVPYNKAHWAEMEGRLNGIRAAKIKKIIFGSAAVFAIVAISSYLIFSNNEMPINESNLTFVDNRELKGISIDDTDIKEEKSPLIINDKLTDETIIINEHILEENIIEIKEGIGNNDNRSTDIEKETETELVSNKEIVSNDKINAEFIVYNNRACLGETVKFESHENDSPVSYTWNFGDGIISHKANPIHIYKEDLVYTVTLTLLNRQTGIEFTTVQQDIVTILPLPDVSFTYIEESKKFDDNALKHPYTLFNVKNIDKNTTYHWSFGNSDHSTSSKSKTIYENKGSFPVKLVAKNSFGCENSTRKKVVIKNGATFYTPNAFTPNEDGDNDNFIPISLLEWDIQFEMTIIDKYGNLIYQTSDKNEPWNGKLNNSGQVLTPGIYLWQVITYDSEGTPHRHNGQINLIKS